MRLLAKILCIGLSLGALGLQPAIAHDHEPPKAKLMRRDKVLQQGILTAFCWTTVPTPGQETSRCVDAPGDTYPAKVRVRAGVRLKIRIHKAQKPEPLYLQRSWKPRADDRPIPATLRPIYREGEVSAWDVFFKLKRAGRDHYLRLGGKWQDEEGGWSEQDAIWNFHVRTRRR
jgi:hypothetical protein